MKSRAHTAPHRTAPLPYKAVRYHGVTTADRQHPLLHCIYTYLWFTSQHVCRMSTAIPSLTAGLVAILALVHTPPARGP